MNDTNGYKWISFETLSSTNDYAKAQRDKGQNLFVTAERQDGGRGTKGRRFVSEKGGVYLTKLTFYKDFLAKDAFLIMVNAAVSVCKTLQTFGLNPLIKWPNDIYVNDKKISGILIENTFRGEFVSNSVVGIGINVTNELPVELQTIATTIRKETGKDIPVYEVRGKLSKELCKKQTLEEYLSFIGYMGRRVEVIIGDKHVPATLVCVDEQGGLIVETAEGKQRFMAAEVSIVL